MFPAHLVLGTYPEEIAVNRRMDAVVSTGCPLGQLFVFGHRAAGENEKRGLAHYGLVERIGGRGDWNAFQDSIAAALGRVAARLVCHVEPRVKQGSNITIRRKLMIGFYCVTSKCAELLHALDFGVTIPSLNVGRRALQGWSHVEAAQSGNHR